MTDYPSDQPVQKSERCIADDQWAIDAFYDGYDKANAAFNANGFTGLKPIIGGIRSLLAAVDAKPVRESRSEWVKWGGGSCPVDLYDIVEIDLAHTPIPFIGYAATWHWAHSGGKGDIIRYRLLHKDKTDIEGQS